MSIYGPRSSIYGKNEALDRLASQLENGDRPVNLETANAVMNAVERDGRITTEESQTLDRVWDSALKAKAGVDGTTPYGRELLMNFTKIARGRLFATQANRAVDPMSLFIGMFTWGMIDVRPSSISTDQNPLGGKKNTAAADAIETTLDKQAGKWPLIRLVEKHYPAAIKDPGHSYKAPELHADVEAEYQALRAEITAGNVDENDPFSPMKAFLDANYAN